MKKVLIFSDTHGYTDPCINIIERSRPYAIIHAGDCTRDAEDLKYIYPDIPMYFVKGNNDFFSHAPSCMTVVIDGVKIFITHGHEQRVKYEFDYRTLREAAGGASCIVFGHTHKPCISYDYGVTLINPGSVHFSRTYAVAEIENGKLNVKILDI